MLKVGDKLPAGTLQEFIEVEGNGCSVGPNPFKVEELTRGRKVVIFGLPGEEADNAFIVGVFSLLDVMLEMPMDRILENLLLPEPVCDALLHRTGIYGPFLELAEACEVLRGKVVAFYGVIEHTISGDNDANANVLEYPTGDDHPSAAGDQKATAEFLPLLNIYYHRWKP